MGGLERGAADACASAVFGEEYGDLDLDAASRVISDLLELNQTEGFDDLYAAATELRRRIQPARLADYAATLRLAGGPRSDTQLIADGLAAAQAAGRVVDDLTARVLAAAWHSGQTSALYALASCGTITAAAEAELREQLGPPGQQPAATAAGRQLEALLAYITHHGHRDSQPGWAQRLTW
jgi:hypothetical protein